MNCKKSMATVLAWAVACNSVVTPVHAEDKSFLERIEALESANWTMTPWRDALSKIEALPDDIDKLEECLLKAKYLGGNLSMAEMIFDEPEMPFSNKADYGKTILEQAIAYNEDDVCLSEDAVHEYQQQVNELLFGSWLELVNGTDLMLHMEDGRVFNCADLLPDDLCRDLIRTFTEEGREAAEKKLRDGIAALFVGGFVLASAVLGRLMFGAGTTKPPKGKPGGDNKSNGNNEVKPDGKGNDEVEPDGKGNDEKKPDNKSNGNNEVKPDEDPKGKDEKKPDDKPKGKDEKKPDDKPKGKDEKKPDGKGNGERKLDFKTKKEKLKSLLIAVQTFKNALGQHGFKGLATVVQNELNTIITDGTVTAFMARGDVVTEENIDVLLEQATALLDKQKRWNAAFANVEQESKDYVASYNTANTTVTNFLNELPAGNLRNFVEDSWQGDAGPKAPDAFDDFEHLQRDIATSANQLAGINNTIPHLQKARLLAIDINNAVNTAGGVVLQNLQEIQNEFNAIRWHEPGEFTTNVLTVTKLALRFGIDQKQAEINLLPDDDDRKKLQDELNVIAVLVDGLDDSSGGALIEKALDKLKIPVIVVEKVLPEEVDIQEEIKENKEEDSVSDNEEVDDLPDGEEARKEQEAEALEAAKANGQMKLSELEKEITAADGKGGDKLTAAKILKANLENALKTAKPEAIFAAIDPVKLTLNGLKEAVVAQLEAEKKAQEEIARKEEEERKKKELLIEREMQKEIKDKKGVIKSEQLTDQIERQLIVRPDTNLIQRLFELNQSQTAQKKDDRILQVEVDQVEKPIEQEEIVHNGEEESEKKKVESNEPGKEQIKPVVQDVDMEPANPQVTEEQIKLSLAQAVYGAQALKALIEVERRVKIAEEALKAAKGEPNNRELIDAKIKQVQALIDEHGNAHDEVGKKLKSIKTQLEEMLNELKKSEDESSEDSHDDNHREDDDKGKGGEGGEDDNKQDDNKQKDKEQDGSSKPEQKSAEGVAKGDPDGQVVNDQRSPGGLSYVGNVIKNIPGCTKEFINQQKAEKILLGKDFAPETAMMLAANAAGQVLNCAKEKANEQGSTLKLESKETLAKRENSVYKNSGQQFYDRTMNIQRIRNY